MLLLNIVSNEYKHTITFFNLQAFFEIFSTFSIFTLTILSPNASLSMQKREGHAIAIPQNPIFSLLLLSAYTACLAPIIFPSCSTMPTFPFTEISPTFSQILSRYSSSFSL